MYEIKISGDPALVEVKLGGLMTPDEVIRYIAELKRQFVIARVRSYAMIIDLTACPIQTQDMTRTMGEHMLSMPKANAIAVVVGNSLARLQAGRLFKQPYARITTTMDEGRAWVLRGVEPASTMRVSGHSRANSGHGSHLGVASAANR